MRPLAENRRRSRQTERPRHCSAGDALYYLCRSPAHSGRQKILFYECGGTPLTELVSPDAEEISLFIGPEGGISGQELEAAVEAGAQTATLGPRILRTETAPLAALTAVMLLTDNLK